jgi:23S rRNA pseudouridine1911/1915/1917 synthase
MRWQSHIRGGHIWVNGLCVKDPGLRISPQASIVFDDVLGLSTKSLGQDQHNAQASAQFSSHANSHNPEKTSALPRPLELIEGALGDPSSTRLIDGMQTLGDHGEDLLPDLPDNWQNGVTPSAGPIGLTPVPMALSIVHEDDSVLVLDKPWGLVVHPGAGTHDPTLVHGLLAHSAQWSLCGGEHKPGIVHRLDKDTSGLMVVAKTDAAHRHLSAQFAARSVEKKYWAFVWGTPAPPFGRMEQPLGRDLRNRLRQAVDLVHGRPALTRYRTLASQDAISLLECDLMTGRTHQIRVHCAWLGHPLLGDGLYGHGHGHSRQALHSRSLAFDHPASGKRMHFEAPLAADLIPLYQRVGAPLIQR